MPSSTAIITTSRASIYLQQLCKHFSHKVPVEFTAEAGSVSLPFGNCALTAEDDTLTLAVTAEPDELARMRKVIGDHLARFAFRENPEIEWRDAPAA
ncbi:DUF2218 domain-containing protein [Pikeienuella piscinae]|uniref:DUF2218 domain-containing protein n=1 Tax=Pikeienuella piscinae TaxID=2748098 RepID=A0A7L5BT38_9RHOB|nr:DUF2218 domain-containing protein [Pikeienuella piscinae]QIE54382.1 DUF2218 domain-containing protein [Pikeienuella piscinae]